VLATRCGVVFTQGHAAGVRLRPATRFALGALAACLGACGDRPGREAAGEAAAPPTASPAAPSGAFVVFTAPALTIDRLDVPVPVPATVGSTPSPQTLSSDAPDVVSLDAAGALVGHRSGRATVRTPDGRGVLEVEVRPVSALAVVPARLTLRTGGRGRLCVVAGGSGEEVPAEAVQWASDAPDVALVNAGAVEAGARPGLSNVLVTYGGQSARAVVAVEPERPARAAARPGAGAEARRPAK